MGSCRRFVSKYFLENNIKKMDIVINFTKAEALILDKWSSSFYENLEFDWENYQEKRKKAIDEYNKNKNFKIENFKEELNRLSNIYYNLCVEPNIVDILLAKEILNIEYDMELKEENFEKLSIFIKNLIDDIFKYKE